MDDKFIRAVQRYGRKDGLILDVGCREGAQAAYFKTNLPQDVWGFEPNPYFHQQIADRLVDFVPLAALDYTGDTEFYTVISENRGASSIYEPPAKILPQDGQTSFEKITVGCTRLDDWLDEWDGRWAEALWMDVQGAELPVLHGLGSYIDEVSVIATEVELEPVYLGTPTQLPQLSRFMHDRGFILIDLKQEWEKEAVLLYVRGSLL